MKYSKKERTQNEIIAAAKEIVHDKGYESVTVRYLAEVTGYSYTNLYHYYKNLSALLWALRLDMIEDMIMELTPIKETNQDPVEEIKNSFFSYVDYFFEHPNVFRFFYFSSFARPEGDERYQKIEERFDNIWKTTFWGLINEGVIQTDQIEIVAKTIIYAVQGMIMLSLSSNGDMDQVRIKEELVKLINYLFHR